jgi:tetratricopeptide (TPR) repeat protein
VFCFTIHAALSNSDSYELATHFVCKWLIIDFIEQDKPNKAYEILQNCRNSANRYKLALLCSKLSKFEEAENALLNKKYVQTRSSRDDKNIEKQIPNGAAGYYLLGMIHQKKEKDREAFACFSKALELDPTLWCAFERLAEYNKKLNLETIFPVGEQISVVETNRLDQNPPFKQCTSSELFNAYHGSSKVDVLMKTPYDKDNDG